MNAQTLFGISQRFLTFLVSVFRNLFGSDYTETHYSEDGKRVTFSHEMVIFLTKFTEFL